MGLKKPAWVKKITFLHVCLGVGLGVGHYSTRIGPLHLAGQAARLPVPGGCIHIFFFNFTNFSKMSQNFAPFVRQFGIQNLIISDSFKFSAPLLERALFDLKSCRIWSTVGFFGFGPKFCLFHHAKLPRYKRVFWYWLAGPSCM